MAAKNVEVRIDGERYQVALHVTPGPSWLRCERELEEAGVTLPLQHRSAWARASGGRHWLLGVEGSGGRCCGAVGLQVTSSRSMPGHLLLRADKVGASNASAGALRAALVGLRSLAAAQPRVLSVDVALFSRDAARRALLREQLSELGWTPSVAPQAYVSTSVVDLERPEREILAGFHATARRHVRAPERKPVRLGIIQDESWVFAMHALVVETRARTRGSVPRRPLSSLVELSRRHPEWLRIVGVFCAREGKLLAFASAQAHGDHVVYTDAASARLPSLNVPLGYAPLWELMRWSKRVGARWFDLGGITGGTHDDASDPLGGISDFKRYFKGTVERVGEEWSHRPRPLRARVHRSLASLRAAVTRA